MCSHLFIRCGTCGSAFSQAAHLKNHAKVHSGEKPFKCDICSAAFADRFALKRHRVIHEKYGRKYCFSICINSYINIELLMLIFMLLTQAKPFLWRTARLQHRPPRRQQPPLRTPRTLPNHFKSSSLHT